MRRGTAIRLGVGVALAVLIAAAGSSAQAPKIQPRDPRDNLPNRGAPFTPKFEALAETRLVMEGLAFSNYRSLHKILKDKPADADTWMFARGQALLIAETGNLLLLRPPRNAGRDTWMKLAMAMREDAGTLARKVGARDHAGSKTALTTLTNSCNRCHQTFRVNVRIAPEAEMGERDSE